MTTRSATKTLLMIVLGLPLVLVVLEWVNALLTAMEDSAAVSVTGHVSLIARVAWLVALVGLVIILAVQSLDDNDRPGPDEG
jgi:hypothetical protein